MLSDPKGSIGIVKNIYLFADVQFVQSNEILYNVPSPYLFNTVPCIIGCAVIYKNWIGRVEDCTYSLTIQFKNGSLCKLLQSSSSPQLESIDINSNRSVLFFPGQRVKAKEGKLSIWDHAKFIHGKNDIKSQKEGVIIDVDYESVEVTWLTSFGFNFKDGSNDYPNIMVSPKELLYLKHFSHTKWEIGEHCYIDPRIKDKYRKKKPIDWNDDINKNQSNYRLINPTINIDFYDEPNHDDIQDYNTKDNNISDKKKKKKRLNSKYEKRKLKKKKQRRLKQPSNCAQIIRTQTYLDIEFQDGTIIEKVHSKDIVPRKIMENDFCPGNFVLSVDPVNEGKKCYGYVKSVNYKERTCVVKWFESNLEEEVSVYSIEHHPDLNFSLCDIIARLNFSGDDESDNNNSNTSESSKDKNKHNIGQIIDIRDGKIGIIWLDDTITYEDPLSVIKIDEDMDEYYSNANQGLEWDDEYYIVHEEEEFDEEDAEYTDGDYSNEDDDYNNEDGDYSNEDIDDNSIEQDEENQSDIEHPITSPNFLTFPSVPSSHHYIDKPSFMTQSFAKRIMSEWNILSSSLPKGVWVGTYEDRIDLLSVLIEGSADTPYYRSIFEFDIYLTSYYPTEAPLVYYRSRVPKFNPNLNEDGSVCLSLLGTWVGKGVEVWNAEHSNLLQLIVSIQGLILGTSEPYYLEAGYDKQKGTEIGAYNSKMYNERALLHSLQLMPKIYNNPMIYFEEIIYNHFKESKDEIIEMITKFLELKQENNNDDNEQEIIPTKFGVPLKPKPSHGFLISLEKIFPSIKEAFN